MSTQVRPDGSARTAGERSPLDRVARAAQAVLVGSGAVLLVLGVLIWIGRADGLISVHVLIGMALVVSLWTIAAIAARSGVSSRLVAPAVAWSIVAPVLGTTQEALVVGNWHWTIQLLHLVVALGVVMWGRALVVLMRKPPGDEP